MSETNAPPPSDPALKAAKIAVFILSALIILALIGLVVGAAMKLAKPHAPVVAPSQPAGSLFMLPMGARVLAPETARAMLKIFFATPFGGGRHAGRVSSRRVGARLQWIGRTSITLR